MNNILSIMLGASETDPWVKGLAIVLAVMVGIFLVAVLIYFFRQFFGKKQAAQNDNAEFSKQAYEPAPVMAPSQQPINYTPAAFGYEKRDDSKDVVLNSFEEAVKQNKGVNLESASAKTAEKQSQSTSTGSNFFNQLDETHDQETKNFSRENMKERKDRVYDVLNEVDSRNKKGDKKENKNAKNFFADFEEEDAFTVDNIAKDQKASQSSNSPASSFFSELDSEEDALVLKDTKNAEVVIVPDESKPADDTAAKEKKEIEELREQLKTERAQMQKELADERAAALEKIKQQYALYQKEIDREHKELQEQAERERKENIEAQNQAAQELYTRMQEEIAALRMEVKNEEETKSTVKDAKAVQNTESVIVRDQTNELAGLISELAQERKEAREETRLLKKELESERLDNEKKLKEQFELLRAQIEQQQQNKMLSNTEEQTELLMRARVENERSRLMSDLKNEHEDNVRTIQEKYDALIIQLEEKNDIAIRQSEEVERHLKEQYDAFKVNIAKEAQALADKNRELQKELDSLNEEIRIAKENSSSDIAESERQRIQEQIRAEYEANENSLREKYLQLRTELQRESKQLAEKSEEIKLEMEEVKRAQEAIAAQNARAKAELEAERIKLEQEAAALRTVVENLSESPALSVEERGELEQERKEMKLRLQREYEEDATALKERFSALEAQVRREEQAVKEREQELIRKEQHIISEEVRIKNESIHVTSLITEREYTPEERNRILADYTTKLEVLRARLRENERAARNNNKEFVPLRRIKDTLERDSKLLRKREAIVAKQQVLVYGVNNITDLDPERIRKLEQDVQQLAGLQQSVANCEDIMHKNKDRYPTLENLSRVLSQQRTQLTSDIAELEAAVKFFENIEARG